MLITWRSATHAYTQHIVSSREHTPNKIVFTRSALVQAKLNQLDEDMFPLPKYDLAPQREFDCECPVVVMWITL